LTFTWAKFCKICKWYR